MSLDSTFKIFVMGMRYFVFVYIVLFFTIASFDSCTKKKNNKSNYEIEFINKTDRINQNVLGKQLTNPTIILGDSIFSNNEKIVLLLTISSDCSGCRMKGFQFVARINEVFKQEIAFIVGSGLNEGFEKKNNGLTGKIYQDEKAIVKQELHLFHTPSLVLLDNNDMVDRILSIFPYDDVEGYDEEEKFDEFLMAVIAL